MWVINYEYILILNFYSEEDIIKVFFKEGFKIDLRERRQLEQVTLITWIIQYFWNVIQITRYKFFKKLNDLWKRFWQWAYN